MEKILNDYLEKIERYLKPLPISERVDIVKEIQSEIFELQSNGKNAKEILGDLIAKGTSFSWTRVLAICAYYSLASLSGLVIIPTLAICAPVFILCGIVTPIIGAVKLIDYLLNLGIPYVQYIGISGVNSPILVFIICVITGIGLYLIGRGCWKLLVYYIKGMSKVKNNLSI